MTAALNAVPLGHLHALLDGVSRRRVHKASEVATILFRYVDAHVHTIEMITSILGIQPKQMSG